MLAGSLIYTETFTVHNKYNDLYSIEKGYNKTLTIAAHRLLSMSFKVSLS